MNALELIEDILTAAGEQGVVDFEEGGLAERLQGHEVRIAQQPNWPFEYNIGEILGAEELEARQREEAACPEHPDYLIGHAHCDVTLELDTPPSVIYIAEAGQIGYLPGYVSKGLGWR
jgi:hypothetical protein